MQNDVHKIIGRKLTFKKFRSYIKIIEWYLLVFE